MLSRLNKQDRSALSALPRSLTILLENILAHSRSRALYRPFPPMARWWCGGGGNPFRPSRILMQDTAGVAALADLAALRDYAAVHGHRPETVDAAIRSIWSSTIRCIDHSGSPDAAAQSGAGICPQ
jgi:aconitate hydratase